ANQNFLPDLEAAFDGHDDDNQAEDPGEGLKAVVGQIGVDVLLGDQEPPDVAVGAFQLPLQIELLALLVAVKLVPVFARRHCLQLLQILCQFFGFIFPAFDLASRLLDLVRDPHLRRLGRDQQLENGIDRQEVKTPQDGGEESANDGQDNTAT